MKNPFDQFDAPPVNMPQQANPFDQFDAVEAPQDTSLGHYAGVAGRALVNGASSLPALAANLPLMAGNGAISAYNHFHPNDQFNHRFDYIDPNFIMDAADVPKPDTSGQRLASDVISGLAGARSMQGGGIDSAPKMLYASSAAGSGAGGLTREAGGSPTAQLIASTIAGMAPSVVQGVGSAAVRGVMRGGQNGIDQINDNLTNFEAAGTTPSTGQAAGGVGKFLEGTLQKVPGSGYVIAKKANSQQQELADTMKAMAENTHPNANVTDTGNLIKSGVDDFKNTFQENQKGLYGKVDALIDPQSPTAINNTADALAANTALIPGAENTSRLFVNPKMVAIADAIKADSSNGTPIQLIKEGNNPHPYDAIFNPEGSHSIDLPGTASAGGTIPYQAVSQLRSKVGNAISNQTLVPDVPTGEYKSLYAGLSQDIKSQAKATSTEALDAWQTANDYTKNGMRHLEELSPIVNAGTPEKIYQAALSGSNQGATTINSVMSALPQEGKNAVTANVIKNMGLATDANQGVAGNTFSTSTFLTNWNKLSPEARQTIFGTQGKEFQDNMSRIANVVENIKTGTKAYANPSGTASAAADLAAAWGGMAHPVGVVSGLLGGNAMARGLTNPNFVKWLAQTTKVPPSMLPAQVNNLAQWSRQNGDTENLNNAMIMQEGLQASKSQK